MVIGVEVWGYVMAVGAPGVGGFVKGGDGWMEVGWGIDIDVDVVFLDLGDWGRLLIRKTRVVDSEEACECWESVVAEFSLCTWERGGEGRFVDTKRFEQYLDLD